MRRYYEFAIAVTLIAVVSLFLLASLDSVRSDMEEALVQSEAASMRLELAEAVVHRVASSGSLPQSNNPVDWVASKPASYRGAFDTAPDERSIWFFDRQAGELISRWFARTLSPGARRWRWQACHFRCFLAASGSRARINVEVEG